MALAVPEGLSAAFIKIKPREATLLPLPGTEDFSLSLKGQAKITAFLRSCDAAVIGPGLGSHPSTRALVRRLLCSAGCPLVVDADGLNALAGRADLLKKRKSEVVLTPHPGEMGRLLGVSVASVQASRKEVAKNLALRYKITVVLKGHGTVVAGSSGEVYLNKTGNPGMATAGSGDVLAGMIAAFLGQGLEPFQAAKYGVYLHGLAGDLAAKQKTEMGMIASDIVDNIPGAIKRCS